MSLRSSFRTQRELKEEHWTDKILHGMNYIARVAETMLIDLFPTVVFAFIRIEVTSPKPPHPSI